MNKKFAILAAVVVAVVGILGWAAKKDELNMDRISR